MLKYIDETQATIYDTDTQKTIPNDISNRFYRSIVIPYLDQGNVIEPYKEPVSLPKTLPIIEGSTDSEKIDSIINALRVKKVAI